MALAKFGLAEKLAEIIRAGARLAREVADAADRPMFVAGSIGPLPRQPAARGAGRGDDRRAGREPAWTAGPISSSSRPSRTAHALERCAAAMRQSARRARSCSPSPIVEQGETASGEPVERMLAPLPDGCPQPIAWGMNCGIGPDGLLGAVERAVRRHPLPLVVQPNAGMPKEVENRRIYFCSPEYLTTYAKRFVGLGAAAVGGCCGTTPEHIREIARPSSRWPRAKVRPIVAAGGGGAGEDRPRRWPRSRGSAGGWPHGNGSRPSNCCRRAATTCASTMAKSQELHERGVDAINIPDGPRASSRHLARW